MRVLAALRPLRSLCLGPRLRAAQPLRQHRASGDRKAPGRGVRGTASLPCNRYYLEGPLVRVHFIIGRRHGVTPKVASRGARSGGRSDRPHLDGRFHRRVERSATIRHAPARWLQRYRRARSRRPTGKPIRRTSRCATCGCLKASRRIARSRSSLPAAPRRRRGRRRAESLELRPADSALGTRAGAGEHGLSRGR